MAPPTRDLERLIKAGANVSIPASRPAADLIDLAKLARTSGVQLTLRGTKKPIDELVSIANAGGSSVVIECD